jgi:sugar lactone lactonase YvrE
MAAPCITRIPAGKLERRVQMPLKYPIMPAFGGADLKALFITSAAERRNHSDEGGPFAGLPPVLFNPARS